MNRDLHFFLTEWFDQYVNRYRDAEGLLPDHEAVIGA